jgi:hypothetical protein
MFCSRGSGCTRCPHRQTVQKDIILMNNVLFENLNFGTTKGELLQSTWYLQILGAIAKCLSMVLCSVLQGLTESMTFLLG